MADQLTLYYHPASYYSQKAALALLEKNVQFSGHYLVLMEGEHLEPWFMRLNRSGKVPVLKDNDKLIPESESIISYVDQKYAGTKLIPTETIPNYHHIHKLLTERVPIEIITYGTFINPDMSATGLHPAFARKSPEDIKSSLNNIIQRAEEYATKNEELKEDYINKSKNMTDFLQACSDRKKVQESLESLQSLFDEIELQLEKVQSDNKDSWLFGCEFTSADITLTVLLNRLGLLGQGGRYFNVENRPSIHSYYQKVQKRESFRKLMALVQDASSKK